MKTIKLSHAGNARLSDQEVIHKILTGEKQLYEILMRRYNQTLYRAVRSYVKDQEVEDIMQDAYVKAFEKLHQFKGEASFSTWLVRIGINEALQYQRKNRKAYYSSLDQQEEGQQNIIQLPDTNKMDPEKRAIKQETRLLLERAIDQLPQKYRIVYILREVEGWSNSEMAQCLNISQSNAKVRLHRARQLLKEHLYKASLDKDLWEFGDQRCNQLVNKVLKRI